MDLRTLYRDIVETSPDGIWVIDSDGRTLYANPRVAQMLDRGPEEIEQLTVFDVLDETGRDQFAAHLLELRRGEVHHEEVECLWVRADGSQLWVSLRESPLYDDLGNLQGFLHRVSDYSDRRRLIEDLRHSQYLLAEAQRIAKVGSYEWDVVEDAIVASDELHAMYGVSREQFGGDLEAYLGLVHADDRRVVLAAVEEALGGTDTFDFEVRVQRGDGTPFWVRGRGELFRDTDGTPLRVWGTHQDISDAKESELVLRDLAAQNALMQAISTAANEAQTLIQVLAVAQGLLLHHDDWTRGRGFLRGGLEPDGLLPLHLDEAEREADLGQPERAAFERGLAREARRVGGQVWDEETHPGQPSIAFPVRLGEEVAAVVVITASTPFVRHDMIRSMIDQVAVQLGRVAERDRAARELAAARDAAMAASRQKSEFLATMSHEIRTPLNGVIGLNDLLLRTDLDAHQKRLASGARVASRALLGVVTDILDFSKIEAGRLELESVDFDVRPVFDQVASLLGESARSKGLELLVSCHPDVPDRLRGDPTRLAQILVNLGSNAVKFTEEGEVSVRATVEPHDPGRTLLRVEVSDTGIGVEPEKREHVFDSFVQADTSTTREYGGTGLGLTISRELVAAFGGEIGVESVPGEGSTFWFTADLQHASTPADREDEDAAAVAGRRVLVVDDNPSSRLILTEHLLRWQARTDSAAGAIEALDLMRAAADAGDPYVVVLLDLAMPVHGRLDLARMISGDDRLAGSALVMLTSSTEVDPGELAAAGVRECLTKPVLSGDVLDVILRVLNGHDEPAPLRRPSSRRGAAGRDAVPPAARQRLLVVEDNPVNQLVALGILETLGYAADTADDGQQALEMFPAETYAAVLMDVQMPRLDGYAATRALRELEGSREGGGTRVPVLAMTAAAVEGERDRCLAAGMDDFLTKPVNPDDLEAMLRRWLGDGARRARTAVPAANLRAHQPGVLDLDRLDMLCELDPGNSAYLDKAIGNFVARAPESVHALRVSIATADHRALTQAAHRIKGSALNLGLPVVGHLAHELEMLGDAGSTAGAPVLLEGLEEALGHAVTEIRTYQHRYQRDSGTAIGQA